MTSTELFPRLIAVAVEFTVGVPCGLLLYRATSTGNSPLTYRLGRWRRGFGRGIGVRHRVPRGARIVAFWHTHGSRHYTRRYFSEVDTQLVTRTGLPFFLADPEGAYWVFKPGDRLLSPYTSRRLGLGTGRGYARGRRVLRES